MNRKAILRSLTAAVCAAGMAISPLGAFAGGEVRVYVDGQRLEFDVDPVIENERTLVPMRAIFEALNAEVTWDDSTKTVSAVKQSDRISITIGSNVLYKNDEAVELDVGAKIVNERTLVPVRAVSESFDAEVRWDADSRSVVITSSAPQAESNEKIIPKGENYVPLTDDDMEELKSQRELVRYDFEQSIMPGFVINNGMGLYDLVQNSAEFKETIVDLWDRLAAGYVMDVQRESETEYPDIEDFPDTDSAYEYHLSIAREAGITAENYIELADCFEKDGVSIAMIIFKEADKYVQCKYLAIAAAEGNMARYFTAEHDIEDDENWYFCEVAADGQGVLDVFARKDAATDFKMFLTIAADEYNNITR